MHLVQVQRATNAAGSGSGNSRGICWKKVMEITSPTKIPFVPVEVDKKIHSIAFIS
jgi:hypothetical protein